MQKIAHLDVCRVSCYLAAEQTLGGRFCEDKVHVHLLHP